MSVKTKTCFVMAVLVFFSVPLFAYDGTVWGGLDGNNFTRYNWIQQASSLELARSMVNAYRGNLTINTLFAIGEDDVDEEDVQVVRDMEAYIQRNFRVSNGDAFSYVIKRGNQGRGWDGWILLSHYSSSQGWLHYLYYFLIQ